MEAANRTDSRLTAADLRDAYVKHHQDGFAGQLFDLSMAAIEAEAQAVVLEQLAADLEAKSARLDDEDQCQHGARIGLVTAISDMGRKAKQLREATRKPFMSEPAVRNSGTPAVDDAAARPATMMVDPQGLAAVEAWMRFKAGTFGLHWKNAKPIIETYFAAAPTNTLFLVTVKLPKNPDHNPRAKVTETCPVAEQCTDSTGEHHTVAVGTEAEVESLREQYGHITRVETVHVSPAEAKTVRSEIVLNATAVEAACAAHAGMSVEDWAAVPERQWKSQQREEVIDAVREYLFAVQ